MSGVVSGRRFFSMSAGERGSCVEGTRAPRGALGVCDCVAAWAAMPMGHLPRSASQPALLAPVTVSSAGASLYVRPAT